VSAGRRQLRLVDVDIDLSWSDPGLQIVGESLYADAPPGQLGGVPINLRRTLGGYVVEVAAQSATERHTLSELFQDAEMEITEVALERLRHRYLPLHAAVVERAGAGLLLVGAHDAGKTSLACALARCGATLLSDDVAPVRPADLTVFPFPRDLILHEGTRRALGGLPPSPGFKCFEGYRYLPPTTVSTGPPPRAVPVCGLLFPHRAEGVPAVLSWPVGSAASARCLLEQCFDLEGVGGVQAIDCAARLARLPAARVGFGDAADAVEPVWRWWGSVRRQVASEVEAGVVR
jgi:hypothetical protein